jgi:hypothetical protein
VAADAQKRVLFRSAHAYAMLKSLRNPVGMDAALARQRLTAYRWKQNLADMRAWRPLIYQLARRNVARIDQHVAAGLQPTSSHRRETMRVMASVTFATRLR